MGSTGAGGRKGSKGSLRRGTRLFADQPIHSGLPAPIPCGQLEALSPHFWLPPAASTPSPAAALHSQVLSTSQVPSLSPTPTPSLLLFPRWGLRNRGASFFSLSLRPPPPTPCRGSQENDLSCWGGGWGRSWSLSSARTLAYTHTLRHTAAAQAAPPPLLPHCGDTCPPACSASAPGPASTPALAEASAPASQEVPSKEKGKTSPLPSVGLLREQKGEIRFSPRPQKEGYRIQTISLPVRIREHMGEEQGLSPRQEQGSEKSNGHTQGTMRNGLLRGGRGKQISLYHRYFSSDHPSLTVWACASVLWGVQELPVPMIRPWLAWPFPEPWYPSPAQALPQPVSNVFLIL